MSRMTYAAIASLPVLAPVPLRPRNKPDVRKLVVEEVHRIVDRLDPALEYRVYGKSSDLETGRHLDVKV